MSKNFVLNYHDVILRENDLEALYGTNWITDTIISFYLEYLERKLYKKENRLAFLSPEVTQCIKMSSENEVAIFLDPWNIKDKDFVFFPLNDNLMSDQVGGSHWSLLVLSLPEKTFFHFDSMSGNNYGSAKLLRNTITPYCQAIISGMYDLVPVNSLQQENGYDCGVHLLCNINVVVEHILEKKVIFPNCPLTTYDSVRNKRSEILALIKEVKSEVEN